MPSPASLRSAPSPAMRERGDPARGAGWVRVLRSAITRAVQNAWLVLILIAAALPARANDFATLVAALAADSFADKEEAVAALGRLGDARAIPVLAALKDGRLLKAPNGRLLVAGADKPTDAITGTEVSDVTAASLDRIRVNNRLRGAIEASLGALTLFSPDPAARFAAAQDALRHPSADQAEMLEKAIAAERDPDIRIALKQSLSAARLVSGSKEEQLAALRALGVTTDPQIKNLLDRFRAAPDTSPELRQAAEAALASIDQRLWLVGFVANLFHGISLGSVLLLAAIGLAITFGVMGVINMAHGEMIMLGAYTAYLCQQLFRTFLPPGWIDGYLVVAVPVAFLFTGAVGVALERSVIRFLYGRPLETLLATWGVSLILQQAVRSIFGSPNKEVSNPSWMTGGFDPIGGFTVTWNRIVIILFCFAVLGTLVLLLNRTNFGLHMRAVTQNRAMASVMGIRTARIDALTFGLGSGIAGMAGVALSQIGNVSPNLGTIYIVDSFLVVVFGGVGNLLGTLVGALSLGIVNKFLEPVAGAILGKIVVLVAIILFIQRRPRGLFALKGRTAEAEV
jgi:urea transport system permease protein